MFMKSLFQITICWSIIFRGSSSQTESLTEGCNSPLTRDLRDDQFSASSVYDVVHNASAARFGSGGWIAGTDNIYQHLKIDLEEVWEITKLILQDSDKGWYSRTFRVSYSKDGYVWMPYNTRHSEDPHGELFERRGATTTIDLHPSLKARFIALNPASHYSWMQPSLLIELFGCKHSTAPTAHVTETGNNIDVDTTWILSQSPIVVHSPIVVRPSVTLTIQAGVSVFFTQEEAGIEVWGTLISYGIPGLNVLLSSIDPVLSAHSKWRGVVQNTGGNITMGYTILRQAITGLQGNGSRVRITDSEIYTCRSGVRLYGGYPQNMSESDIATSPEYMSSVHVNVHRNVDGLQVIGTDSHPDVYIGYSNFHQNFGNGIVVFDWVSDEEDIPTHLMIINTSFSRNSKYGIKCENQEFTTFLISNSVFDRNLDSGLYFYRRYGDELASNMTITDSTFSENRNYGIFAQMYCFNSYCKTKQFKEVIFINNVFLNQKHAVKLDYYLNGNDVANANIKVENNTFVSNAHDIEISCEFKGFVQMSVQSNLFQQSRFPLEVKGNTLSNNISIVENSFTDGISKSTKDIFIDVSVLTARFYNNTFKDCSLSTVISLSDGVGHLFAYNSFIDTVVSACYVSIGEGYEENEILNVDYNYWGSLDIKAVKAKICDFFLDSTKAVATLNLYFENEAMVNLTDSGQIDTFRSVRDELSNVTYIGGIIDSNIDFSDFGVDELILNKSLLILKDAHVEIAGVSMTIRKNRGIKVYGSLSVGMQKSASRNTVLKLNGKVSSSNRWNGISMSSADVRINNVLLYGMSTFLDVSGGNTTIVLSNCSSTTEKIKNLINVDISSGNLSLLINESRISTSSTLVYIRTTDSDIDVRIFGSSLESGENVLDMRESNSYGNITLAKLDISNSLISSRNLWKWSMYSEGCSSHLAATITGSSFSARDDQLYFNYLSMDMTINDNKFGDAKVVLQFDFCGEFLSNFSKEIRVIGNDFNSYVYGKDLLINEAETSEQNHAFYIANNTFANRHVSSRNGITCKSFSRISRHALYIDSNVFTNFESSAIVVDCGLQTTVIKNNSFMTNKKCIYVDDGYAIFQPLESFEINGNNFSNNSDPDGIIYLDRKDFGRFTQNVTENVFEGNTGTVIALKAANIRLKYNVFENKDAFYNVKVMPGDYKDQEIVNASLNYWGTSNPREISKGIYDFDYDNSLLDVEFRPYLGSNNKSDIQNAEEGFISENGEVGGNVNGNITLHQRDSPFVVISNINIGENDTLFIEAGVKLRIRQGVGIFVKGNLNIHGRNELPVTLTSEEIGQPWRGLDVSSKLGTVLSNIYINDTEGGITIRGSAVSMSNVTSTFSRRNGISVIFSDKQRNMATAIDFATLENNFVDGIQISGDSGDDDASVVIRNSVVAGNKENGMKLTTNARIDIVNCLISENRESGIYVAQSTGAELTYINDSIIESNTKHAIKGTFHRGIVMYSCRIRNHTYEHYDYWGRRNTLPYIELKALRHTNKIKSFILIGNSYFEGNTADWIDISVDRWSRHFLEIRFENNVVTSGRRAVLCEMNSYYNSDRQVTIFFQNNTLERNSVLEDTTENALVELYFDYRTEYHIEIVGNVFRENTAQTCLVVTPNMKGAVSGEMIILENVFKNNNFSTSVVNIQRHIALQMHQNVFAPPHTYRCAVDVPNFDLNFAANATHNYWGINVAKEVIELVCGFEKDMSKSIIWSFPYYQDENLSSLASITHLFTSDTFGGEVTTDTHISMEELGSMVEVQRSIMIRKGAWLYIESGATLMFAPNRGIYVQGALSVIGKDFDVTLANSANDSPWYGIIVNTTSHNGTDRVQLYGTRLQNTIHGIITYTPNVEIKRSEISNSETNCLSLFETDGITVYDFENSTFKSCDGTGINLSIKSAITIMNANIHDTTVAIETDTFSGSLEIRSCSIINSSVGISISPHNYDDNNIIRISRNYFQNIKTSALSVVFAEGQLVNNNTNRTLNVDLNTFRNACGIEIQTWNHVETTFRDNDLSSAVSSNWNDCCMKIFANGTEKFGQNIMFGISTNRFEDISAKCIIHLKDNNVPTLQGTFVQNVVINNDAGNGVILANGRRFTITENIFDNPDSVFDVVTNLKGTDSINVTNNWWGSSEVNHVLNRIIDQRRQPDLILFEVEPVLLDRLVECDNVNNCSSHGECISPNHCRCTSGWTGTSCMQIDCSDVNHCYGNGVCIGPNTCSCDDGWSGKHCIIASCITVNNCSGHGVCVKPNVCTCTSRFAGNDCSSCLPFHGGPSCQPCPECQHGICDPGTGLCKCNGNNWAGYLCDRCSDTFYGPDCLPLIKILEIIPNRGPEKGGTEIHVWGHNFPGNLGDIYKCRFGDTITDGKWLAWNHVVCIVPRHPEGEVILEISTDESEYTNDRHTYYFYSTCPRGSCGRSFAPPRGQCVFGSCSCFLPWTGENCSIELLAPVIAVVSAEQTINETETYTQQLKLEQGDPPVRWYLFQGPEGMTVDEKTGYVRWANTFGSSELYHIDVRASNIIGEASRTWSLLVPLSYRAYVSNIQPIGVFPVPRQVRISGNIAFISEETARAVPVNVIVTSSRSKLDTFLEAKSDQTAPDTFVATYYPRPDDAGLFSVSARHPGNSLKSETSSVSWSVLGMKCEPSTAVINEIVSADDDLVVVTNISTLINVGNHYIDNITGEVDGLPGAYTRISGTFHNDTFFIQRLHANDSVSFDLVITNAKPLYGTTYIIFTTNQGTSSGIRIDIKLSVRKPVLSLEPSVLSESVVRGTMKVIDINITNVGDVTANNVSVSLPSDSRFSLVSFTSDGSWSKGSVDNGVLILPKGSAQLSISVIIKDTEPLGEISGHIYINAVSTSSRLPYTIFITSAQTLNVTFTVKDEYTYFATGSPLVTNATVSLSNPRRGFAATRYTENGTGFVIFENINEDRYTLYAEAEYHSSYRAVILITADKTHQDIFLPRVAVKYSWTVEKTTVEDAYIIDLRSTFETYVPMPVVTIQPAHLDTAPLEEEINSTIEFTITNHGLIRADNVRFSLPTTHPYLTFESMVDSIGSIAANTSIIVPIRTVLKHRERRSSGSVCVDILLLYSYECSGTQTRSAFVLLTRGYRAGSCGSGSIRFHGHLSGHASGYALAYISTTSLTCDCLQTFFKSCVLAFVPGAGCPLALFNYMTADHSSDKTNLKDEVLGILDILVGCLSEDIVGDLKKQFPRKIIVNILKKNLPILEHMYTAVRCVQDVEAKCSSGRTRREVNSDVINAVVLATGPMMNFIYLAKEVLGNQSFALEETWYEKFKKSVGDHTEQGVLLSKTESSTILDTITEQTYKDNLNSFLERYNNTASAWENGTLPQLEDGGHVISFKSLNPMVGRFISDIKRSKERGFDSIFEEYEYVVKAYYDAEEKESSSEARRKEGVCARVRIRIEQELVLTRDAFKAKLEIENGETSDLENIKVEIQIMQTSGSSELWNDKFSVGKPTLIGISSVDGNGRLGPDLSGSADWLIIPYSTAAPEDNTEYDFGGQLSYSVGGTDFSVPLLPDTITVSPNPSLIVHYFHEKYVRGDDALTTEIEPIVPFTLAVMVTNGGYGVARALKITSGQPEIIENEKGLLITFKIIAAQLGNYPIAPTLTVDFGDISSFETKTARWLLTSTLMGKFYNYSATFENINALGDPQLSLIDVLQYHDLIHLVRIDIRDNDDNLDDFLVNNFPDQESIPDRLYNSENGTDIANVFYVNVTDIHIDSSVSSSIKVYKQVNLTLHTNTSVWFYTRIENTFTSSDILARETLLNAVTQYGRNILLDKNVWQTTHIHDKFYLHLFDFIKKEDFTDARDETEMVYILTYGSKNLYSPKFNATSYSRQVPIGTSVGSEVLRVNAYDRDQDNLLFKFRNESSIPFYIRAITSTSVAITLSEKLKSPGLLLVELVVYDDGIPSRSTFVNISIHVIEGEIDSNTTYSSSRTTEYTPTTEIQDTSTESDSSLETSTMTNTTYSNIVDNESSSWVIPLVIVCSVLLVILIAAAVVCLLRKKQVIMRRNDNTFELK